MDVKINLRVINRIGSGQSDYQKPIVSSVKPTKEIQNLWPKYDNPLSLALVTTGHRCAANNAAR